MSNHTPGPWHVQKSDHPGGLLIKPVPGQVVAQCDELPEMVANAQLIAAAPNLLAALLAIKEAAADLPKCKSPIPRNRYIADIARWADAAISEATGAP